MSIYKKQIQLLLIILITMTSGCSALGEISVLAPPTEARSPSPATTRISPLVTTTPTATTLPTSISPSLSPTAAGTPSPATSPTPTVTPLPFEVGSELTIPYLRGLEITGSEIKFLERLPHNGKYHRHLVSYISEGYKIFGLLTIPLEDPPPGGYKAIVFNHGYIPPTNYKTTERYEPYVDYLARSGFVVFKIDYRGHGNSQGQPTGSYFSPGYTIDAISALKSLQKLEIVDPEGIGMWGHSMAGNLVLRAMLIEPEIQAGVIWSGAVYSYDDFAKYGISDDTYRPPPTPEDGDLGDRRKVRQIFNTHGMPDTESAYWKAVSLTEHIEFLSSPLQLHHAKDDRVVNIAYARELAEALRKHEKAYKFHTYQGGGHNLNSPYFDQAMLRTVAFFRDNL